MHLARYQHQAFDTEMQHVEMKTPFGPATALPQGRDLGTTRIWAHLNHFAKELQHIKAGNNDFFSAG